MQGIFTVFNLIKNSKALIKTIKFLKVSGSATSTNYHFGKQIFDFLTDDGRSWVRNVQTFYCFK